MLIDLHVHSKLSPCSSLDLAAILATARQRGLDGVCITDHESMSARHQLREGVQPDGLVVLIGQEYATPEGDFLLFGPFEELEPGLPARELLPLVHKAGGASVAAHPFRAGRPVQEFVPREGLCTCLEVDNGRNSLLENRRAADWSRRFGLPAVCGSDAHTLAELGARPTRFSRPISSRRELILALREGRCRPHTGIRQHSPLCNAAFQHSTAPAL